MNQTKDQASALRNLRDQIPSQVKPVSAPNKPGSQVGPVSVVVTSGKGGVGKTHFSINLAIALSRIGKRPLLFDADMGLANVDIILGIHPEWHLVHVLDGLRKVSEIVIPGPEGIRIIPASSGVERLANMDSALLGNLFHELQTVSSDSDFLIVDTGAGISRTVMHFAASGDQALVVVTPEPASFADAYATIKCIFRHNPEAKISLVVNCCRRPGEGREMFDRMRMMVMQFLKKNLQFGGELPFERDFVRIVRKQRSILMEQPNCGYARSLHMIARNLSGQPSAVKPDRPGYFARFLAFITRLEDGDQPLW